MHHFCAGVVPPSGREGVPGGAVAPADQYAEELLRAAENERQLAGESNVGNGAPSFGCYLPGRAGVAFANDTGILMRAGSRVSFQMHYSASGEEGVD